VGILGGLGGGAVLAAAARAQEAQGKDGTPAAVQASASDGLDKRHAEWLAEVRTIMTPEERDVFLRLTRDYQRDAFVRKFWQVRDPVPKTGRNEMRERWDERVAHARSNYGGLTDARSQVLLIHGEPHRIIQVRCTTTRIPAEIWIYQGSDRVRFRFLLIFARARGLGEARVWVPGRGDIRGLVEGAKACINGHLLEDVVAQVRSLGGDYSSQLARVLSRPRPRNEEWVAAFAAASTDLPLGAPLFHAEVEYDFLGRFQSRTVVQGRINVDPSAIKVGEFAGYRSRDLVLVGEVVRDQELFESFRYNSASRPLKVRSPSSDTACSCRFNATCAQGRIGSSCASRTSTAADSSAEKGMSPYPGCPTTPHSPGPMPKASVCWPKRPAAWVPNRSGSGFSSLRARFSRAWCASTRSSRARGSQPSLSCSTTPRS